VAAPSAHVELAGEDAGVRRVADRDERARHIDVFDRAAVFGGLDTHAVHAAVIADDFVHRVIPGDTHLAGLLEREQAILEDLFRAEFVTAMHHGYVAGEIR